MIILGALAGFFLLPSGAMALTTQSVTPVQSPAASYAVVESGQPTYAVTLTAYNAVPAQTDSDPLVTASGAFSNPEVVAARSVNLAEELPFGTIIEIDGSNVSSGNTCGYNVVAHKIGYRVIADAMNARYTDRVDVLFDTNANYATTTGGVRNAAGILGVCKGITVRVVGYVDIRHIPKTQAALASLVSGNGSELALK